MKDCNATPEQTAMIKCKSIIADLFMSKDFDKLCEYRVLNPQRFVKEHKILMNKVTSRLERNLT